MIEKAAGKIINICSMMSELGRETVSALMPGRQKCGFKNADEKHRF